ncbi:MAG: hypothetical protein FOGNACKC_00946 [Anaerolineae bacterium]|nr:hypothetical protein [Anaerolineae bacterium]
MNDTSNDKDLVTLKVWQRTRDRLAHLRAYRKQPVTQILDEFVEQELRRYQEGGNELLAS